MFTVVFLDDLYAHHTRCLTGRGCIFYVTDKNRIRDNICFVISFKRMFIASFLPLISVARMWNG